MKFTKPAYDAKARIYSCDITDGFRLCVRRESGSFVKEFSDCIDTNDRIKHLIHTTQGWFSKPLTEDFLSGKIRYDIPTADIPTTFEGSVEWQAKKLLISKESFLFICDIVAQVEDEKLSLDFPDDEHMQQNQGQEDAVLAEEIPMGAEQEGGEVIGIGPTRQQLDKKKVMRAREKAARALFHAERLTQEYCTVYGEETDWEEEEEDEEEEE
jgi:hypothetical protein